jgi:DNA invertase Pin-like site-specific DNA recombinase
MTALPTTPEQLRGLRCARLLRESSEGQREKKGPAVQRRKQDRAIERLGLIDSGVERLIVNSAWSGPTGDKEPPALASQTMRDLVECGEPVLLVGFSSRFMRSTTDAGTLMRELHRRGTVLYICDGDLLSTRDHATIIDKVLAGWHYSNDLSRLIHDSQYERFIDENLPVGVPPFGFRQLDENKHVDWSHHPENAETVRKVFTDYDTNNGSTRDIADRYGLDVEQVKVMLRNPAYKGVARFNGEERPASFAPIVAPEVWERVAARREARRWASGGPRTAKPSLLRGRFTCQCGRRLTMAGAGNNRRRRVRHLRPLCAAWGPFEHKPAQPFIDTIKAALRGMTLSPDMVEDAVQRYIASTSAPPRDRVGDRRRAKQRRALAAAYEAGELDEASFIAEGAALRAQEPQPGADATDAIEWTPEAKADFRDLFSKAYARMALALDHLERTEGDQTEQWVTISSWAFERFEYHDDNDLRYQISKFVDAGFLTVALPKVVTVGGEGLEPPTPSV